MSIDRRLVGKALKQALQGTGAHVGTDSVFAGLDWRLAGIRPENAPHSVYELLNHMRFWQDWVIDWLDGGSPRGPKHASGSWPGETGPAGRGEWNAAVRGFRSGCRTLTRHARESDLLAKRAAKTPLDMLQAIAAHNSYHAGQVVQLRQILGAWPPPSGGLTW